jgi:hypothetical protein
LSSPRRAANDEQEAGDCEPTLTSQDLIRDDELSREKAAVLGLQGGALLECFEVGHDAGGLLIRQVEVGHLRAGLLAGRIEDPALEILRAVVRERAAPALR